MMGWGSGCGGKLLNRHLALLRETRFKVLDLFALFLMGRKTDLSMSRTSFKGHFTLGETREGRCVGSSGSPFKCQLPEATLK